MVELSGGIDVKLSVSANARTRVNLALHHLFAACRAAARVRELESQHAGEEFGEFWEEILHCSLTVVSLSVAAAESFANETLLDSPTFPESMPPSAVKELMALIDRKSILDKYRIALSLISGATLSNDDPVVERMALLIELRNAVVHFRPEWFDSQKAHARLSERLGKEISASPFLASEPLFPRAWASANFAEWALVSTVGYLNTFFAAAKVKNPLEQFRERLSTLARLTL